MVIYGIPCLQPIIWVEVYLSSLNIWYSKRYKLTEAMDTEMFILTYLYGFVVWLQFKCQHLVVAVLQRRDSSQVSTSSWLHQIVRLLFWVNILILSVSNILKVITQFSFITNVVNYSTCCQKDTHNKAIKKWQYLINCYDMWTKPS